MTHSFNPTDKARIAEFIEDGGCTTFAETISTPIYWLGRSWAVTSYGLDKLDGKYYFTKERVFENWDQHLAEKGGMDMADFRVALAFAQNKFKAFKPKSRAA